MKYFFQFSIYTSITSSYSAINYADLYSKCADTSLNLKHKGHSERDNVYNEKIRNKERERDGDGREYKE